MGHGHHHILALNQILVVDFRRIGFGNFGAPRIGKLFLHLDQFGPQDAHQLAAVGQGLEIVLDIDRQAFEFLADLVTSKAR